LAPKFGSGHHQPHPASGRRACSTLDISDHRAASRQMRHATMATSTAASHHRTRTAFNFDNVARSPLNLSTNDVVY
jgi:hypothetical protein